jgi:hypothetical protein
MVGPTRLPRIPLPSGWPPRVRSAVIHVISLAHYSLTSTRSWAANNWNARIRLKQQNDRLRQEVALLIAEMRIKDARMQCIPAQRRPHYQPIERLAILELRAARGWSLSQTGRCMLFWKGQPGIIETRSLNRSRMQALLLRRSCSEAR